MSPVGVPVGVDVPVGVEVPVEVEGVGVGVAEALEEAVGVAEALGDAVSVLSDGLASGESAGSM
jgi:hypothetical protein